MPAKLSYESTAGPLSILIPLALMLSGIMTAQIWYYWNRYKEDPLRIKILVWSLYVLETVHSGFCLNILYTYAVSWAQDPLAVENLVWSSGVTLCIQMAIVFLAQGFYIYRIWQLSDGNVLVTAIPGILLFCRCAFGVATASLTYRFTLLPTFKNNTAVLITVNIGLGLAVVVDLLVTVLLIYYLNKRKSPFRRTRRIVHSLMFYAINTGALTILFSTLTFLSFNFVLSSLFACFIEIVCKLYANSALAMLNARRRLKRTSTADNAHSVPLEFARETATITENRGNSGTIEISVSREVTAEVVSICSQIQWLADAEQIRPGVDGAVVEIRRDEIQKTRFSVG